MVRFCFFHTSNAFRLDEQFILIYFNIIGLLMLQNFSVIFFPIKIKKYRQNTCTHQNNHYIKSNINHLYTSCWTQVINMMLWEKEKPPPILLSSDFT